MINDSADADCVQVDCVRGSCHVLFVLAIECGNCMAVSERAGQQVAK